MRALMNELDDAKDKDILKATRSLDKQLNLILVKLFSPQSKQRDRLKIMTGIAWDHAMEHVNKLEDNSMFVSFVVYSIFNEYRDLYKDHAKQVNEENLKRIYEHYRPNMGLKLRANSDKISMICKKAINKVAYDYMKGKMPWQSTAS
jgi:hypothetical protein